MSDLPKSVGPFEVRDRLGHGGMGMVYLAHDPMLDRPVAVKVLKVPDDETRRRFIREARLHAKVQHPHIVSIYAVGEHEGQPYLAMEYIAGSTLAAIIRSGDAVPLARKVTWLAELSAGLHHAHQYGIVHRDVKPSNILITRDSGRLRLLDFGIAHGQEAQGMTMAGMVIGTPQYMSPEQITGKAVDGRSDIFSVGLVAYELLTGAQAFGGDNVFDISRRIVGEAAPALASACRDAPMTLLRIVDKCLEKDAEARYQDGRQLERELMSVARRLDPDHTLISVPLTAPTSLVDTPSGDAVDDPSTAASALAARVREAVGSGRLLEAEQILRDLRARHGQAPGLSGLRVLVEEARQMSQAVDLAGDAERALAQAHLTEAQALIEDIERLAPAWSGLPALRQRLQAQQHERRVAEALERVVASLDAGRLEDAEPRLRHLASLAPDHPEIAALRSRYHTRIAAQQATSLASRARAALQEDQLDDAAALVAEALAITPGNQDALAVQDLVGQRRRAQRVVRAAHKVLAAIDAAQPVTARKAFDQLTRIDSSYHDLDGLRQRVERLERGEGPETASGAHSPHDVRNAPRQGLPTSGRHQPATAPVLLADRVLSPRAEGPLAVDLDADDADDDELSFSRPVLPSEMTSEGAEAPDSSSRRSSWIYAAAGVAVLALLVLGYVYLAPGGSAGAPPVTSQQAATDPASVAAVPATYDADGDGEPDAGATATAATPLDAPEEVTPEAPPARPTERAAAPTVQSVQELARNGRYTEAIALLPQVSGLSAAQRSEQQRELADSARQRVDVARHTASDFRAGGSAAFVQGASRQDLGEEHFKAGRMRQAVLEFTRARDAFEFALSNRTAGNATPAASPATAVPATASPAAAAAAVPPGPAAEPPSGTATAEDAMARWKTEQVQAVLQQFRTFYEQRNISGLQRIWPTMDSTSERRFRGVFGTPGELQWILLSQRIVRQQDKATIIASVMNVTPLPEGSERHTVNVTIDVAPRGDALVITSLRQQ